MKFQPVSHSWVALHPQPQGVIQFIGGAFFGTFVPMFFYRSLLQCLFNDRYTIIILPFNFTFDHYAEAGFLIREQYEIMPELVRNSILAGYDHQIYLDDKNFSWIGHSIGCKYIALLEAWSTLTKKTSDPKYEDIRYFIESIVKQTAKKTDSQIKIDAKVESILTDLLILINDLKIKREEVNNLIKYYIKREPHIKDLPKNIQTISSIFINDQPSLLLAPVNTGLESAIPEPFASIFISLGLNVKPTKDETYALIKEGNLFNLAGLNSFQKDQLALSTCQWFEKDLRKPPEDFKEDLKGGHLRPLGIQLGNLVINFPDIKDNIPLIESIHKRHSELESLVSKLFQRLQDKQSDILLH